MENEIKESIKKVKGAENRVLYNVLVWLLGLALSVISYLYLEQRSDRKVERAISAKQIENDKITKDLLRQENRECLEEQLISAKIGLANEIARARRTDSLAQIVKLNKK